MHSPADSMPRIAAISWIDYKRMRADPGHLFIQLVLPLMMILVLTPMARAVLRSNGYLNATGAEQSVPGMAVMFAFMSTMLLGGSFFKEHEWHTWERLRASPAMAVEIVLGKSMPVFAFSLIQLATIWVVGIAVYHLNIRGSYAAIGVVTTFLSWAILGLGLALVSLCRTIDQLGIIANMGSFILGGLSGAFSPVNLQSGWVGMIARFSPLYWALNAYHLIIFDGKGISSIFFQCLFLFGFGLVGVIIAALKFRMADVKVGRS